MDDALLIVFMGNDELIIVFDTHRHGKMLVPPGGTNSSVGGTNSSTNGINKRKYPPY